ncbi:MAG: Peptide deformylase [Microgenomates group bacterium GW2011_GWA1_46_7]|nr:MAG: Peptide deformylase [Microgenomates group bacterium GW2011_GWA1_46_7]
MNQAILTVPHQVLRRKSAPIEQITPEIRAHIHNLMDTIQYAHDPEGVGLSFPQIGLNLRGFVTFLDKRLKVYLNPVILDASKETTLGGTPDHPTLEGCLSIPWLYGPVPRPKKIKIQAIDERGVEITKTLSSFPARLFLHEYDHLEGVLFTDYTLKHNLPLYFLDRDQDKFVPIQDPSSVIKW